MVPRTSPHRRQPRGFTLLLALGTVAVVTMAVMLSFSIVGREASAQSDTRRKKEAFYAAEAGLAEGREKVRLLMTGVGVNVLSLPGVLGAAVNEPGLGDPVTDPWYEVLPGPGGPGTWNYYGLEVPVVQAEERKSGSGTEVTTPNQPYEDYPLQERVRYRVFLRNDKEPDDITNPGTEDYNRQVWLIAVGEVEGVANSRPTRAVVQSLVTQQNKEAVNEFTVNQQGGGGNHQANYNTGGIIAVGGTRTLP